jgi:hypothetical protein
MEYKVENEQMCDFNYLRYVGWEQNNACFKKYFSEQTINIISRKVTELTMGVDPYNRKIIVPRERICEVMDGVYKNFRPSTADIYSRYNIPNDDQVDLVQSMIDQTIEIITDFIRNEIGIEENNKKLSAWIQLYGDFNIGGLRQTPIIKIREKRPAVMQFNMNY